MRAKVVLLGISLLLLGSCAGAKLADTPAPQPTQAQPTLSPQPTDTARVVVECTLLACGDVLSLTFERHVPDVYAVSVGGADGEEVSVRCSKQSALDCSGAGGCSCWGDGVSFSGFAPKEATITVQWDGSTVTKTVQPSYSTFRPNGPDCPPECRGATVSVVLPAPAEPAPSLQSMGMSRSDPFPPSEVVSVSCWETQVLDVVRGDEAWQILRSTSEENGPAPEEMEYLLVKLRTRTTCADGSIDYGQVDLGKQDDLVEVFEDIVVRVAGGSLWEPFLRQEEKAKK